MTDDDARKLVFACLMVLKYESHFRGESPALEIPTGLLRQALAHLEERLGVEGIANLRASFASYGLEFSDPSSSTEGLAEPGLADADHAAEPTESSEKSPKPANFIPRDGLLARCVRMLAAEGHSQARIARELRLNRRTVTRLL
jgi:hypothetical protein